MKILLFANGSSQNHGCEAINETTMELFGDNYYFIGTTNSNYDRVESNIELIPYSFQKTYSIFQRIFCRLRLLFGKLNAAVSVRLKRVFQST